MKRFVLVGSLVVLASIPLRGQEHHHSAAGTEKLGKVSFPISCASGMQGQFERGVALLHSFWYEEAEKSFQQIAASDASCAMAYWGQAMSIYRPLWVRLTEADLTKGRELMEKARTAAAAKSPRERDYIAALSTLYQADEKLGYHERTVAYCDALQKVHQKYPADNEASVFYALALLASAPDEDTSLRNPKEAIALLNEVLKQEPNHPGVAHYLIHAADNPQLAELGLPAARRYAEIAPASPHALHMPGHIFARLGLWQEDIQSNLASLTAARQPSAMHIGAEHQVHAMDFLEYAYLQVGDDAKAKAMVDRLSSIRPEDVDAGLDGYLNQMLAHFPAMYALETHDWKAAEALPVRTETEPYFQATTYWAHAVGAGHLRDVPVAKEAVAHYEVAVEATRKTKNAFRAQYMLTNGDQARAWLLVAEGKNDEAVDLLRSVADKQDAQGKGEVELPAREMLGDMLLELGRGREALREYEKSLKTDPNRFNGLYGAAHAAELSGEQAAATRYLSQLLQNCGASSPSDRPELSRARALFATN
jgi:tetratricopeptide (TPR) repeat protein